jgi:hypothetical protein
MMEYGDVGVQLYTFLTFVVKVSISTPPAVLPPGNGTLVGIEKYAV